MTELCFQLKGSVATILLLELYYYTADAFVGQLRQKVDKAPQLLLHSPIVISLDKLRDDTQELDCRALVEQCRNLGLQPIGFRACPRFDEAMRATGLAILPQTSGRSGAVLRELLPPGEGGSEATTQVTAQADVDSDLVVPVVSRFTRLPSKIINQPVRSGQQVYARDCDLIVMAHISEGAEILADGNIHVYGGLRGRALAGVQGDSSARIFCHSLEAELLAVAGNFMLSEDFRDKVWKKPVQVCLKGEKLCIEPL
jgi:septum site-determining protein MinC